ncbi:metalloregulator ArsR/SmtB family transcription factor [Cellulomonas sp. KRMCY2]|uniref:helix-turn-helix transcriptional regulator n=1 Tax=Cellulomonas sp. KRMCY2 TaxID=1304865 RepID=UPI00045EB59F|nr:helix-turn-helix domain-containing protein [Cellulomonas sp. KRMCY2]
MVDHRVSAYRALASESRVQILHVLQQGGAPLPVDEIAPAVGLHVNTAREHLDRLVASGFVHREPEVRTTRGRPRMLYRSVDRAAAATVDGRAREQLARMLVDGYGRAMESPAEAAQAAGERWAGELAPGRAVARPAVTVVPDQGAAPNEGTAPNEGCAPPERRVDHVAAWVQLAAVEQHFEDLGFEPEADIGALQVHLRRCPFIELARERTEVVCGVHLGLARGVLAHQGGPLVADRLEAFVGPRHCVLHLREA